MSENTEGTIFYNRTEAGTIICWRIGSFSILPREEGTRIWSPLFNNNERTDFIRRINIKVPRGSVGLFLYTFDTEVPLTKSIRVGLVDQAKTEIVNCKAEWFEKHDVNTNGYFVVHDLFKKNYLCENTSVQLFCELINTENGQISNASEKKKNAHVEKDAAAKAIANKESAANVSEKCSISPDEDAKKKIKLEKDAAAKAIANKEIAANDSEKCSILPDEDTKKKLKNLGKLSQNFQELYVGGKHTDVVISVKDGEFKAHKAVLAARSSVFDAMFTHELSESNTGIVPIEDCEPAVFEEFLFFVYTGRIQQLSSENVCGLYYVADKYQISELKEECVSFLKKSMTVETICDVICLSTKCNETELLDLAISFFARNMEEILVTVKWQLFLEENPTKANELTLKALKLGFVKRNF